MSEKENPFLAVHKYDEIINLWQTIGKGCQVFYDKGASILILKKNADIYFLRPNEIRKSQKFQLKTKMYYFFLFFYNFFVLETIFLPLF